MIIYGKNAIKEAILAKRSIYNVWIDEKFKDNKFIHFLNDNNINRKSVSKEELNTLAKDVTHQGIVANVEDYLFKELDEVLNLNKKLRLIILDEITDPHNLGAIIRSAEASKIDAVIISKKHQAQITPTVVKTSSGGIEYVNLVMVSNINVLIKKLKEKNILVVGTDGNTSKIITDVPKDESVAFVLGSEGQGLRQLVKRNCDLLVKIPMYGKVNSLNVSVAAALVMYLSLEL